MLNTINVKTNYCEGKVVEMENYLHIVATC